VPRAREEFEPSQAYNAMSAVLNELRVDHSASYGCGTARTCAKGDAATEGLPQSPIARPQDPEHSGDFL